MMKNIGISKEEYGEIISEFFEKIDFRMPAFGYDWSFAEPVETYFAEQKWPDKLGQRAVEMGRWISTGAAMSYPSANKVCQLYFAIFTTYVLFIDDITTELGDALEHFDINMLCSKPQGHPVLQSFVKFLSSTSDHFGLYARSTITKSTVEFISGCIIEQAYNHDMTLPSSGAINFPGYFRQRAGYSEPYAHFIFPEHLFPEKQHLHTYLPALQDLSDFVNFSNDIVSFYKESVVGEEKFTYICNVASVNNISLVDALRLTCLKAEQSVKNVRAIFRDHPKMLKVAEEFFRGSLAWYINQGRYKLSEIDVFNKDGPRFILMPTSAPEPQL